MASLGIGGQVASGNSRQHPALAAFRIQNKRLLSLLHKQWVISEILWNLYRLEP
jgi:hypothetical protein